MISAYCLQFFRGGRYLRQLSLFIVWIVGLLFGAYVSSQTAVYSLMPMASLSRMSIVSLFLSMSAPFLVSYILQRFYNFFCVLPLVLLKAFSFSFIYCGVSLAYGSAGWLVRSLLLFSDSIIVFVLIWFWFRQAGEGRSVTSDLCISLAVTAFVGCMDYFVISPFVDSLLKF